MELSESKKYTEVELTIPVQNGVCFEICLNLQGVDELHLNVDDFRGEWFPCADLDVAESFLRAVRGLLSGEYRIVVFSRKGKSYKRLLQSAVENRWKTEYANISIHWPCFNPQVRYIQNGRVM